MQAILRLFTRRHAERTRAEIIARLEATMKPDPRSAMRYAGRLPPDRRRAFLKRLEGEVW